ncbi:MAG: 50S ribosomal protein L9 [Deltaproteobacteria bacterium]|nr:50S ribosomal protein L9 [Deltaproteobacteria bacterium]MBW1952625.1 50S ribosomal protein L9 [Deltaproteobacteria bacterium]MBW1986247.1 50S ribosomal protein L9 [Deltaproteobacteria bacterium]MBW2134144.1 50S ribosomal protein L9 [Deltaproteobacteria bacterium]
MKLILTEDLPGLGEVGNIVEVARGYGRNYLIPQGKALEATPANVARFEHQRARRQKTQEREKETALALAARLEGVTITIPQRVGEKERLYGSVTSAQIAEALTSRGFELDRKMLELPEPIKSLGTYEVTVRLHSGVRAKVMVEVIPETA